MIKLLIIADDFTGALDTGVLFAAYGATTRVRTGPAYDFSREDTAIQVLVLDAQTRHLSSEAAYAIVFDIVRGAMRAGIPFIYKKTDSALRGNIGSELAAVMDAGGLDRMTFVPAHPTMGRITRGGVHYIEGVPVSQSIFGSDPFEPVRFSDIRDIVSQQTQKPVILHREDFSADSGGAPGIQLYDAGSVESLSAIAEAVGMEGLRFAAGCAGLAATMANMLNLTGSAPVTPALKPALLVVCGSVNPVTQAQLKAAQENGVNRVQLTLTQKLNPQWLQSQSCESAVNAWLELLRQDGRLILDTNDPEGSDETKCFIKLHGLSAEQVRLGISSALAALTKKLLDKGLAATLMCTGGDTLLALMQAVGAKELTPVCELEPGVVLSHFLYDGNTYNIITKSGGFGPPALICSLARRLSQRAEERTNYDRKLQP